jgi:uncharacterized protein YycO
MTTTTFKVYEAGEAAAKFKPGDFILTHHKTIPAKLIRVGQWLRYHGELRKYSHWNHVAVIVDEQGTLIEAVGRGVVYGHIEEYRDVEYYLVNTRLNKQSREQTVAAARSFLNDKYGWLTIVSLTLQLLTGIKIQFSSSNSKVCSTLLAMSLWAGGVIFDRDPDELMPADIAAAFKVEVPARVDPTSN